MSLMDYLVQSVEEVSLCLSSSYQKKDIFRVHIVNRGISLGSL